MLYQDKLDVKYVTMGMLNRWAGGKTQNLLEHEPVSEDYKEYFLNKYTELIEEFVDSGNLELMLEVNLKEMILNYNKKGADR